jgi:UDP-3-O-[3-hydroxymyristoyl] glucosamine N-acyltransferase
MDVRLAEIVEQLGGELIGPPDLPLAGLASLASAGLAHISFVTGDRHREAMRASRAGALIVPPTLAEEAAQQAALIVTPAALSVLRQAEPVVGPAPASERNSGRAPHGLDRPGRTFG